MKDSVSLQTPEFPSSEAAHTAVLQYLVSTGRSIAPREKPTLEVMPTSICINDPRKRCITNIARRWSLPLAIGEFCWHASASTEVDSIAYYAPNWRQFSNSSGVVYGSCYGRRIFGRFDGKPSQWERIIGLLRTDPASRRAVLNLHSELDELDPALGDVPCASTVQFLVRNGAVDAVTYMRSNDVIWGMPYDIFLFTMLQELLAAELDVKLGRYYHIMASLHFYSKHSELVDRILDCGTGVDFAMPALQRPSDLPKFLQLEEQLREDRPIQNGLVNELNPYWRALLKVLELFANQKKSGRHGETGWVDSVAEYATLIQV